VIHHPSESDALSTAPRRLFVIHHPSSEVHMHTASFILKTLVSNHQVTKAIIIIKVHRILPGKP